MNGHLFFCKCNHISTDKFISPFICLLKASQNISLIIIIWFFNLQRAADCLLAILRICDKMLIFSYQVIWYRSRKHVRGDEASFSFHCPPPITPSSSSSISSTLPLSHLPTQEILLGCWNIWGRLVDTFEAKNHSHDSRDFSGHTLSKEIRSLYSLKCSSIWTSLFFF